MGEVFITIWLLGTPLMVCTICRVGWIKRRLTYMIVGVVLYMLVAAAILAISIAVGMSRMGAGRLEPSGWDSMAPLIFWMVGGLVLLVIGFGIREPYKSGGPEADAVKKLKTLREVDAEAKNVAEQVAASDR